MIKKNKIRFSILAIAAIVLLSVGGTFAYIEFKTGSVINLFKHGVVNITTDEDFDEDEISYEVADLMYHLTVMLADNDMSWGDIFDELEKRR